MWVIQVGDCPTWIGWASVPDYTVDRERGSQLTCYTFYFAVAYDALTNRMSLKTMLLIQMYCELSPSALIRCVFYNDKLVNAAVGKYSYLGTTYTTVVKEIIHHFLLLYHLNLI